MKCPKCGRNDNIKYRVKFYDDDERGTFYIRVDGSRDSSKKVKWYDNYFEALNDMKNNLPCAYPYFQMVEAICCNEFMFSDGHINNFHKEGLEINKHQARLDKVLSKFYECDAGYLKYNDSLSYIHEEFILVGFPNVKSLTVIENLILENEIKDLEDLDNE